MTKPTAQQPDAALQRRRLLGSAEVVARRHWSCPAELATRKKGLIMVPPLSSRTLDEVMAEIDRLAQPAAL